MKTIKILFILSLIFSQSISLCMSQIRTAQDTTSFSFVFMCDIHLMPELNAVKGFRQAIDSINHLNPDFVVAGGDMIKDALHVPFTRADSLYRLYLSTEKYIHAPVYHVMGNHEIFGLYTKESGADSTHPEFLKKMYEHRIGKRFYVFNHKGWRFYVLDSTEPVNYSKYNYPYRGFIDKEQLDWLEKDLAQTPKSMPLIIISHFPFLTVDGLIGKGSLTPNLNLSRSVENFKEVLKLFNDYNLKLVLQGHLHWLEDIYIKGIHFITGGAVSGTSWKGPGQLDTEEGFLLLSIQNGGFKWRYVDYHWEAK